MKVWISKYALTKGIFDVEGEQSEHNSDIFISKPYHNSYYREDGEWHNTKSEAIERAEKMRIKKIESLNKQIKRMENLKFQ